MAVLQIILKVWGPGWPITNTAWVRAQFCKLQKRVHSTRSCKW